MKSFQKIVKTSTDSFNNFKKCHDFLLNILIGHARFFLNAFDRQGFDAVSMEKSMISVRYLKNKNVS